MQLCAGVAETIITPPVGTELAGYAFGPSVGILDHLRAQALVLEAGDTQAAIVTADLLGFGAKLVASVRRQAQETTGIPAEHIVLAASHSHSAPGTAYLRQWGPVDSGYLMALEAHLVGLIGAARGNLRQARLGIATGHASNLAENRRGQVGLIDPTVPVLRLDGADGSPMVVVFSHGCHPVSLHSYRNLISPDYPGYARQTVRGVLGESALAMFALGAAGDANPAGYVAGQTTPERSRQLGTILGCEVAKLALDPLYQEAPTLAIKREVIALPLAPLPSAELLRSYHEQFQREATQLRAEGAPWHRVSVREIKRDWAADGLRAWEQGDLPETVPCEVLALRLGRAALVAVPLEVFAETSLAIQAASPADVTMICSNANGSVGYLPTAHAYETEGDYANPQGLAPKVYGLRALDRGAEPRIREAASRLLSSLFQSKERTSDET